MADIAAERRRDTFKCLVGAMILEGDEYARIWGLLTADRAYYKDYLRRTDRTIPLVRLRELRPA